MNSLTELLANCRPDIADQNVLIKGLGEVTENTVSQCTDADRLVRVSRDEDGENIIAPFRCPCSSTPVMRGIWTSAITQAVASIIRESRKATAD